MPARASWRMPLAALWPLFGLRVRTPRLELRYPDDDLVAEVAEVAAGGVHEPDYMPFSVPWTLAEPPALQRGTLQFVWQTRSALRPDDWQLPLVALVEGRPVGMQDVLASEFPRLRVVSSGSWLGRAHQGRGLGKEMRAAMLHLAFAGLGAERAESGARVDNAASLGVSRALGYRENGDAQVLRGGQPVRHLRLVLTREVWAERRRDDIEITGLEPCLDLLGAAGVAGGAA